MNEAPSWLTITRGHAPLILSIPHAGTEIPPSILQHIVSPWHARKDADWRVDRLYNFAQSLGATIIRTAISRAVIDVNRDPSGQSLYPGQATTELCPTTTFDGEPLYKNGQAPDADEIARRREVSYRPYHDALATEMAGLRREHKTIVLLDAHSIRSRVPRLFNGELPHLNLGTNSGASCSPRLTERLEAVCDETAFTRVTDGRFKGGYITRHYGAPATGIHAVQLELAMRTYMNEPEFLTQDNWPSPYDDARAAPLRDLLARLLQTCIEFAAHEGS
jgi:N-formylglutamate deformylase